ncbi:DUF368 domain-containing protein [Fulvivirgaceae bacterium BMA10]|uniref:DUF368 domain-containing protein n=1 Tax=Splendidivirga corallicola TaxID=3051826 RepID=A0ABT8KSZ2_9BACT|nr:DUF368 domain-containing protein [Fulvivirgaceae bacterium BMA10]
MSNLKENILLFLKGVGMGGADIVPGVSGGTVAFITGIYEKLLYSINAVNLQALQLIKAKRFRDFWSHINGNFLLVLFIGIFTSFLSLAKLIEFLLENHPIQLWSFFFGLIIISSALVAREIKKWRIGTVAMMLLGGIIAYFITVLTPAETPDDLWFIFICGAIAVCAMILPGISGSFIVLLLGKYQYMVNALSSLNIVVLLTFIAGCVTGLLSFSKVISWLLKKYHDLAIALLSGFMIGSLNKVWPWKKTIETFTDRHGVEKPLIQENIWATQYQVEGNDAFIFQAILFFALGIGIVVLIEKIAHWRRSPHK